MFHNNSNIEKYKMQQPYFKVLLNLINKNILNY